VINTVVSLEYYHAVCSTEGLTGKLLHRFSCS